MKECENQIKFANFYKFKNFTINPNDTLIKVLKTIDDSLTNINQCLDKKCDCSLLPTNITLNKLAESGSSVLIQITALNANTFKYNEGNLFTGNNACNGASIGSTFLFPLNASSSKLITVRVYDENCLHYEDKTFNVVNSLENTNPPACIPISNLTIVGNSNVFIDTSSNFISTYIGNTANSFTWNTTNATIISGQNTNNITVTFGTLDSVITLVVESCGVNYTTTFNVTVSETALLSCSPEGRNFSIVSVDYNNSQQSITYQYDAQNLVNADWRIKQNNAIITSGSFVHTSNIKTFILPNPLQPGIYVFELIGTSCQGNATKTFEVLESCSLYINVNNIIC